jgi:hypothetical protein
MAILTGVVVGLIVAASVGAIRWWRPRLHRLITGARTRWKKWRRRRQTDQLLVYVLELGRPIRDVHEQSEINHRFGLEREASLLLFGGRPLLVRDSDTGERRLTDRGRARAENTRSHRAHRGYR